MKYLIPVPNGYFHEYFCSKIILGLGQNKVHILIVKLSDDSNSYNVSK